MDSVKRSLPPYSYGSEFQWSVSLQAYVKMPDRTIAVDRDWGIIYVWDNGGWVYTGPKPPDHGERLSHNDLTWCKKHQRWIPKIEWKNYHERCPDTAPAPESGKRGHGLRTLKKG